MQLDSTVNILQNLSIFPLTHGLAYLDPGSGSFILQILLASLLGGLFLVRTYWQKIINFFRGGSSDEVSDSAPSDEDQAE
jgi:hypothetical protein